MTTLPTRSGYDPVARRRHRRLAARLRPLLLPVAVLLSALLLGGRLLPAPAPDEALTAPPVRAPVGRVLVVVTPADPAVLTVARPGAVVDVYGAQDPMGGEDLGGDAPARAGLLVRAAPVVGPGTEAFGGGPDPPGATLGPVLPGSAGGGSVVLAVTEDEARSLAAQQGRGLSLAVRSTADAGVATPDAARPDAGAG